MSIFARSALPALLVNLLLCSCGDSKKQNSALEVIDKTYPVDPDASIRINDPHGSIAIRGGDLAEVQMHATKVASSPDQLTNISVGVTAQQNDLLIKTNLVRPKGKAFLSSGDRVDYELSIPRTLKITRLDVDDGKVLIESMRTSELRANVVDGKLELRNCSGDIRVSVQNGDLALLYDTRDHPASSMDARVLHGSLTLSVPRSAAFHLRAETKDGNIISAFAQAVEVKGGPLRKIDIFSGQQPRSEIQLEVVTGNIIIADTTADARGSSQSASR